MISNYNINLHFNQAVAQRTGYAFKIGDKGCKFNIHCEDLDPTGMNPHIIFNHSDGTCVEGIPTTISARDYEYVIQGNEFGVCGKTVVDVKFYDGDPATQRISTASFMIEILPDTITPFDENAGPYADSLERAKEELDEATSDLADMDALFAQTLQDYIDAFGNTAPINPRGAYDPNELYKPRDAVYYTSGGKTLTYLNNLECTGVVPTNTSNWQPIIDITGIPAIIDNCTSTSTTDALSANQGRVLSENIAANEESGAKNFNVYPYTETTKVENGLTFTDNGDGTITVSAASYPYTVPNQTNFICHNFLEQLSLDQGNYILSGSPIVSDDIYVTFVYYDNEYTGVDSKGTDQPFYLPLKTNHETLRLFFGANSVITEALLFKPMIRDARIIDDTFVPFAKTNKQLTDDLSIKTALISEVYNPLLLNYARVTYNKLGFVCVRLDGCKNLVNATYNDIFTLPLDVPRPSQEMCWNIPIESEVYRIIVNTSGTVRIYPYGGVSASGNIVETLTYLAQ